MKLEAMKRQAGRPSKENCSQLGNDFGKKSSEVLAEQVGQSKNQIFRYIRLTELIPELLDMVDEKQNRLQTRPMSCLSSKKMNRRSFWTRWTANRLRRRSPRPSG